MAVNVETAKAGLGLGVALLGGFEIPVPGLDGILRNAVAVMVEPAKAELGLGVALLGVRAKFGYDSGVRTTTTISEASPPICKPKLAEPAE